MLFPFLNIGSIGKRTGGGSPGFPENLGGARCPLATGIGGGNGISSSIGGGGGGISSIGGGGGISSSGGGGGISSAGGGGVGNLLSS